mmetsp:Transcript_26126/g.81314  ORF Transcript_26126/g.81314 Transcript_26126/m.81314 type:complete len:147 (+) Transcript_26126:209-649(+)
MSKPTHLTWDEETIAEHDKERGTRMKIDEADTPFAYYDPATDPDAVAKGASPLSPPAEMKPVRSTSLEDNLSDLNAKLNAAAAEAAAQDPEGQLGWVADMEADEEKSRDFAKKRSQHYNMSGLLGRKFDDEDDEDEDDDGGAAATS